MLLGKKLFEIRRLDKFWQWSGEKIRRLQDYPEISEKVVHVEERSFWVY